MDIAKRLHVTMVPTVCRTTEEEDKDCIFCWISSGQDEDTEVVQKNEDLVCFRDVCPAAPLHFLVVPRRHIVSCLSLTKDHVCLVENMVDMGKAVLRDQGITDMQDIRIGFHQPPFTSVSHLHLHVLAPASKIYDDMAFKFIRCTNRFISERDLLMLLKPGTSKIKRFLNKW